MATYGKYGISRDGGSVAKKSGIVYYLLFFLIIIFSLLVLANIFDKVDVFKDFFSNTIGDESKNVVTLDSNTEAKLPTVIRPPDIQTSKINKPQAVENINPGVDSLFQESSLNTKDETSNVKTYGSMDKMTTEGFRVDDVMLIHQQVPDSALVKSFLIRQTLPSGKELKIMSNSLEAKLIRMISTDLESEPQVLDKISFYYNSDRLKRQSYSQIKNIAKIIKAYPQLKVLIRGHTDSMGDRRYNKMLSLKRAEKAKKNLIARGVSSDSVEVLGMGQSEPLVSNNTPVNRRKNRRIDISIIK